MRQARFFRSPGPIVIAGSSCFVIGAAPATCSRSKFLSESPSRTSLRHYPIRLMGYGSRKTESEGIASRLKARALAIGADQTRRRRPRGAGGRRQLRGRSQGDGRSGDAPEEQGRPETRAIRRLLDPHPLRARTRATSWTSSSALRYPTDQKARIERYTRELTDSIEKVALAAPGGAVASDPVVGPGPGRASQPTTGLERRSLDQLRRQS